MLHAHQRINGTSIAHQHRINARRWQQLGQCQTRNEVEQLSRSITLLRDKVACLT